MPQFQRRVVGASDSGTYNQEYLSGSHMTNAWLSFLIKSSPETSAYQPYNNGI